MSRWLPQHLSSEVLWDTMLLAGMRPRHTDWKSKWTKDQREAVYDYCMRLYHKASDNPVRVPSRPDLLREKNKRER